MRRGVVVSPPSEDHRIVFPPSLVAAVPMHYAQSNMSMAFSWCATILIAVSVGFTLGRRSTVWPLGPQHEVSPAALGYEQL